MKIPVAHPCDLFIAVLSITFHVSPSLARSVSSRTRFEKTGISYSPFRPGASYSPFRPGARCFRLPPLPRFRRLYLTLVRSDTLCFGSVTLHPASTHKNGQHVPVVHPHDTSLGRIVSCLAAACVSHSFKPRSLHLRPC